MARGWDQQHGYRCTHIYPPVGSSLPGFLSRKPRLPRLPSFPPESEPPPSSRKPVAVGSENPEGCGGGLVREEEGEEGEGLQLGETVAHPDRHAVADHALAVREPEDRECLALAVNELRQTIVCRRRGAAPAEVAFPAFSSAENAAAQSHHRYLSIYQSPRRPT